MCTYLGKGKGVSSSGPEGNQQEEHAHHRAVHISEQTRLLPKRILESGLEEELTVRLGAAPDSRKEGHQGYRNGTYGRQLMTRQELLDIRMAGAMDKAAHLWVVERLRSREPEVDRLLRQAFLGRVFPREVLEPILGCCPTAQTVSRVGRVAGPGGAAPHLAHELASEKPQLQAHHLRRYPPSQRALGPHPSS